jgi:hypothetical protein
MQIGNTDAKGRAMRRPAMPLVSIKLENLDQAREYVRAYLMPMIIGPT